MARYNILLFVLTYVLPMLGMGVCYVQMARHLCHKSALSLMAGQGQAALARSRRDKMKIVKMLALVVVIFMVCWAPYHIYFILSYHYPAITRQDEDIMSMQFSYLQGAQLNCLHLFFICKLCLSCRSYH